jgi:hypothetical protein
MTQQYHNPFTRSNLIHPADQQEYYETYCGSRPFRTNDRQPFAMKLDLWFAGLSLAVGRGLEPADLTGRKTEHFTEGTTFDRDSWRVQAIMLAAIAVEKSAEVVGDPSRMIAIANGLAAAGVPHIVEMLKSGADDAIWNLSEGLEMEISG